MPVTTLFQMGELIEHWRMSTKSVTRFEHSVTSLSWIPSEAVVGGTRLAFDAGFTHYDAPPPDRIEDLEGLRVADRFRFANVLRAWIEVDERAHVLGAGYSGGGMMGSTAVGLGALRYRFQAVALTDIRHQPEYGDGGVRFIQTTGGRTGLPAPRPVRRKPFVQWQAPLVWTTLSLVIHTDGSAEFAMPGASRFPRHWVYDHDGALQLKSGLADFRDWYRKSFGRHTPWGDEDSAALVTEVESALERSLAGQLMRGTAKPRIERFPPGSVIMLQGSVATDVALLLDGVVRVEHDGERLAEYGPGAMLGERAAIESGVRTSSVVAVTPCRVALVEAHELDRAELLELAEGHRREEGRQV
jgi:hypothetical protein